MALFVAVALYIAREFLNWRQRAQVLCFDDEVKTTVRSAASIARSICSTRCPNPNPLNMKQQMRCFFSSLKDDKAVFDLFDVIKQ